MAEWADATLHMDDLEWFVTWNDGAHDRRVLFRPMRDDERRCDLEEGPSVCCLSAEHPGPHLAVTAHTMPFVIAP
jgi:hypothetical protein